MNATAVTAAPSSLTAFWTLARVPFRRDALLAAALGWMLDSMDVMLYSMVIPAIQQDLHMSSATAGLILSATLLAAAAGGIAFGFLADRLGRTRALSLSILVYCLFTGLCALVQTVPQLAVCRILLGLGMGGEWAAGAALVAETWPTEHRAKALALVQSAWAIGYALAAAVVALVQPRLGWRPVFLVGLLPAIVALWIRRRVREPEAWNSARSAPQVPTRLLFRGDLGRRTLIITAMNACSLFAWWGLFAWVPSFLALPIARGGHGLDIVHTASFTILMQLGTFLGYTSFGLLADRFGRRGTYVTFLLVAAALVPCYALARSPAALLLLGPLVGFWGTGYFSGFSVIASEAFPTALRGRALGFAYNLGRIASAAAPFLVGYLADTRGIAFGLLLTSSGFLVAGLIATRLRAEWAASASSPLAERQPDCLTSA